MNRTRWAVLVMWGTAGCSTVFGDAFDGLSRRHCPEDGGSSRCSGTPDASTTATGSAGHVGFDASPSPSASTSPGASMGTMAHDAMTKGQGQGGTGTGSSTGAKGGSGLVDASVGDDGGAERDGSVGGDRGAEKEAGLDSGKSFPKSPQLDDPHVAGTTWVPADANTFPDVPVCFTTAPHREWDGSVSCQAQSAGTDCEGKAFASGQETQVRNQLRSLLEDTWQRVARLRFSDFGACPIDPTTHVVESGNLKSTVIVSFTDRGATQSTTGIGKRSIASDVHVSLPALASTDKDGIRAILREFGHVLGFPYEYLRNGQAAAGPCPADMPAEPSGGMLAPQPFTDLTSVMDRCASASAPQLLSPGDVIAIEQVYGQPHTGTFVGKDGRCLGFSPSNVTVAVPVTGSPCTDDWNQIWWIPTDTTRYYKAYRQPPAPCLAAEQGADGGANLVPIVAGACVQTEKQRLSMANVEWRIMGNMCLAAVGNRVELAVCDGSAAQRWIFWDIDPTTPLSTQQIQSFDGRCVSSQSTPAATWDQTALGEDVMLAPCDSSDPRQILDFGDYAIGLGDGVQIPLLCMNVENALMVPGTHVGLYTCSQAYYNMRVYVSGAVQVLGKCMTLHDDGSVTAEPCSTEDARQIWDFRF